MVKALIFDVFGTCVDWRNSVARDVSRVFPNIDAFAFADAWRAEYVPSMAPIRAGKREYTALDQLHLENLLRIMPRFSVSHQNPEQLAKFWERLDPWEDVLDGLNRLKSKVILAPCSNGSIGLMEALTDYADLPWDSIVGAEIARNYKPHPSVYTKSVEKLGLQPSDVMMVAAHNDDLSAARDVGLQTAFVPRPTEYGVGQANDLRASEDWDIIASDFRDLADQVIGQL